MFKPYYQEIISKHDKLYYNYLGISKKEYPKWAGWKLIEMYKNKGIPASEIYDSELEILVKNFYYMKYISENF